MDSGTQGRSSAATIPLDSHSSWTGALVDVPHTFGHTLGACRALGPDPAATQLFVAEHQGGRVVCPLIERRIGDKLDIATPYGFAGLSGTGPWPGFAELWSEFVRERGYVSGYVALNPLYGDETYADPGSVSVVNETYVLDLRDGVDSLHARLSDNRKRQLRKPAELIEDDPRLVEFFVEHYPASMSRKDAAARHRFSDVTLRALCQLPDSFLLGAVDGGIESVSLFGHTSYGGDFLFNAALPGARHHSTALIWRAAERLTALGVPFLNLGGGMRPGDSLAEYKARFGAMRLPMRAIKAVYDSDAYAALCEQTGSDAANHDGFFPAYRNG